jgi:transketolase
MSGNNHIASALSIVEILIAVYSVKTADDVVILSKGHGCLALYVMLEYLGFDPPLKHHPDILPEQGIPCTTGSLGHGFPIGVGMALAKRVQCDSGRVYIVMGDGECQEGTTWESAMLAAHYGLSVCVVVDRNKLQALGNTESIMSLNNLKAKFQAFGVSCMETIGHDIKALKQAVLSVSDMPLVVIAQTVKGKGVRCMESRAEWHAKMPTVKEMQEAHMELAA